MAVVPAFVGVHGGLLAARVGPTVHAFMEFENIRIVLRQALKPLLHRLIGVVFLELQDSVVFVRPWENVVDVVVRPHGFRRRTLIIERHARIRDGRTQRQHQGERQQERCPAKIGLTGPVVVEHHLPQP